jgi:hypothetical protein
MAIVALEGPPPDPVLAFLDGHIAPRGRAHWTWKFEGAAPGTPRGFWHTDADGAITGFIGLMPTTLHLPAGPLAAAWLVDWVAAGAGGLGVGLGLLRKTESVTRLPLTLGGSSVARDMYTTLRWTQVPIATVWLRRLSARAIAERGPVRRHRALRLPARLAASAVAVATRARRPTAGALALDPVARFDDAWNAVWDLRRPEFAPVMERGARELNRKFVDFPDRAYRCFLVRDGREVVGHLVLRREPAQGLVRGRIVDLLWPRARPEVCAWLVGEACWQLQAEGCDVVQCTASDADLVHALRAHRFARAATLPLFHHKVPPEVGTPSGWFITYLDCDRAYR